MKTLLKISFPLMLAAALILPFVAVTSEPVSAIATCPMSRCPQLLDGYTYVGPCRTPASGSGSLGWIYENGGETCYVSAEGPNF